jgi:hypothetical protein
MAFSLRRWREHNATVPGPAKPDPSTGHERDRSEASLAQAGPDCPFAYSDLSIFQNTGVAGPSSTPVSDLRQALGWVNSPSGI